MPGWREPSFVFRQIIPPTKPIAYITATTQTSWQRFLRLLFKPSLKGPLPPNSYLVLHAMHIYPYALGTTLDSGNQAKAKHEIPAYRNLATKELVPERRSPAPHSTALLSRTREPLPWKQLISGHWASHLDEKLSKDRNATVLSPPRSLLWGLACSQPGARAAPSVIRGQRNLGLLHVSATGVTPIC